MNIIKRELKANWKSTIVWIVSMSAMVLAFLLMFPAFSGDVEVMKNILKNFPPAVQTALSFSFENIFTINGFLAYLLTFLTLAGAIQAMNLGVGIISKEESSKTVDFLLSKPISRIRVITEKITASMFLLLVTNLVFVSVTILVGKSVASSDFDIKTYILIIMIMPLIQLFFLSLGIIFSVVIPKIKSVIGVSLPVVFILFFIGMLSSLLDNDSLKYLSPFKYYDSNYIIEHVTFDTHFLIVEAVFVIVAILTSYIIYIKKDTKSF